MENENEQIDNVEEEVVEETTEEESGQEVVEEEKPKLTLEQQRGILQRKLTKINKELGIEEEPKPQKITKKSTKGELDYGQKAFLVANGIKGSDEVALVQEMMSATGRTLDDVVENKYFQAELKELRESKATKEAIPSSSKRSPSSQEGTVDYWIAKGELPPADKVELRRKVLNERIRREEQASKFSDNSVVIA